ncbi:MAG: hypothetical protein A2W23_03955 [Planctomycetes bacterium RBG_16_43_13]|nr:MAG: hypothetical protein A2W23_03955 [Planctomycetes bacterium RBG_16_43_13]
MLTQNRYALKEWAVAIHHLAMGNHILVLRKGGILEVKKGFEIKHDEFFLFPTYVHQKKEDLIKNAHKDLDDITKQYTPDGNVSLEYYATVEATAKINDITTLKKLAGMHILSDSAVESRFNYREKGLNALILRVYKLQRSASIVNTTEYDGCKSWVELEQEIPTTGCENVLAEAEFRKKLADIRNVVKI